MRTFQRLAKRSDRQLRINDFRWEVEFFRQFRLPLTTKCRRTHDKQSALALGPQLAKDETSLDCLAKADFVREDAAL